MPFEFNEFIVILLIKLHMITQYIIVINNNFKVAQCKKDRSGFSVIEVFTLSVIL